MHTRPTKAWALLGIVAGCAVYTSGIRPDASLDPGSAYLYGRFFMKATANEAEFGGKQSIGLVIRCEDDSSYTFGSLDKQQLQVLQIKPSRCWLIEMVLADEDRIIRKTVPFDPSLQRPLDFAAGHAYYAGDYFGKADFAMSGTWKSWQWAMDPGATDRYQSTTAEMKRTYPNLAALPVVDLRLIPPQERKRDNGVGPSPGEPPMSPDRVAAIAPFIKRSYRTPAECEAACPAGQCFPYRGESGPAMACVVRCDTDANCPQGLTCNCPNREKPAGPACHPIGAAPRESMARICLSPPPSDPPAVSPAAPI
ncbi:MAG: hypothetical protein ACJ8F1_12185 [Polyangia bacterium]